MFLWGPAAGQDSQCEQCLDVTAGGLVTCPHEAVLPPLMLSTILFVLLPQPCLQVDLLQRRKPQLLVATPGRLLDLLDSGVIDFNHTDCVVLDEADKMLSVGFEPQLQRLQALLLGSKAGQAAAEQTHKKQKGKGHKKQQQEQAEDTANQQQCQVLLFSATLPKAVRVTADVWLKPGYESVSCSAGADSISRTIAQVGLTQHPPGVWDGMVVRSLSTFMPCPWKSSGFVCICTRCESSVFLLWCFTCT